MRARILLLVPAWACLTLALAGGGCATSDRGASWAGDAHIAAPTPSADTLSRYHAAVPSPWDRERSDQEQRWFRDAGRKY